MSRIIIEVDKSSLFEKFDFAEWVEETIEAVSHCFRISRNKMILDADIVKNNRGHLTFITLSNNGEQERRRLQISYRENTNEFENVSNSKAFIVLEMGSHGSALNILTLIAKELRITIAEENLILLQPDEKFNSWWSLYI
jgi:hypothetical protein